MIDSSTAYQAAVTAAVRRTYIRAIVNIISPTAAFGAISGAAQAGYSHPEQTHDLIFDAGKNYGTCELNRQLLDGSCTYLPDDTAAMTDQVGYVGSDLSADDGNFETAQVITLPLSGIDILQTCSVYFSDRMIDGAAKDLTIEIMTGDTAAHTVSYSGNRNSAIVLTGFSVSSPTAIRITIDSWTLPSRRVRIIEIMPGIHETWGNEMIASFSVVQQANFAGTALPYGTCTLEIDNSDKRFEPRNKAGIFKSIEERQGIDAQIGVKLPDGTIEYKPLGRYYQFSGGWTTGNNGLTIKWDLVDIVGLITDRTFFPPSTLPTTLDGWVSAIISTLGEGFSEQYQVDDSIKSTALTANSADDVTGKKCGDLLSALAMAASAWVHADAETGKLMIEPLPSGGKTLTLGNLTAYPVTRANTDVGKMVFNLADGNQTQIVIDGNEPASDNQITISNPFIHTSAAAQTAAAYILQFYGGNLVETAGRGDPASEIGDLDTIELAEETSATGRRQMQSFKYQNGVLQSCQSKFLEVSIV